jgi:hypothetical protein
MPPRGASWFLHFHFRRPIEPWKVLEPKLRNALEDFINKETDQATSLTLGNRFKLSVERASKLHPTFYTLGSWIDRDAGGWLIPRMTENLRICVRQKTMKIANRRSKYPEWWFVLVDHIGYDARNKSDWRQIRDEVPLPNDWKKIIVVNPQNHTCAFELL